MWPLIFLFFILLGSGLRRRHKRRIYLPSDRDKLHYLLYLHQHYPDLFKTRSRYGRDLWDVLHMQIKIHRKLLRLREYREFYFQTIRPETLWNSFLIEVKEKGPFRESEAKKTDRADFTEKNENLVKSLWGEMEKIKEQLHPNSFWRSYCEARKMSQEERRQFSLLSFSAKQKELCHHLSRKMGLEQSLSLSFPEWQGERLHIDCQRTNGETLLLRVREGEKSWQNFLQMVRLYFWQESGCESLKKMKKDHFFKLMSKLKEKETNTTLTSSSSFYLWQAYRQLRKNVKRQKAINKKNENESEENENKQGKAPIIKKLRIDEVPPFVAVFRGHAGQDCSTQYSFPYSNNPWEKNFFIFGSHSQKKRQQIKGYVNGTIVEAKGRRVFYLHTIAGKKLSAEEITYTIEAFYRMRFYLGVQEILLPGPCQLSSLINDPAIRAVLGNIIKKSASESENNKWDLKYLDKKIRDKIDDMVVARYDCSTFHDSAYLYRPEKSPSPDSLQVIRERHQKEAFIAKGDFHHSSLLHLILDLKYMDRMDTVRNILCINGVPLADVKHLFDEMKNPRQLSTVNYLSHLQKVFCSFQLDFWREFFPHKQRYFACGLLLAADSMNECYRSQTIRYAINNLKKRNLEGPRDITQFLVRYKNILNRDQRFFHYITDMLTPHEAGETRQYWKFLFLFNLNIFSEEGIEKIVDFLLQNENIDELYKEWQLQQKIGLRGQILFKLLETVPQISDLSFQHLADYFGLCDLRTLQQLAQKILPTMKCHSYWQLMDLLQRKLGCDAEMKSPQKQNDDDNDVTEEDHQRFFAYSSRR